MNPLRQEIGKMLRFTSVAGGFGAELIVNPNLSVFADHFPDQPILPGICLVQAVLLAAAHHQQVADLRVRTLKNMKFMQPVRPGQRVAIDAKISPVGNGDFSIKAKLSAEDQRCAEIFLIASLDPVAEGVH